MSKWPTETELRRWLKQLSSERRRFGSHRLHILLMREGANRCGAGSWKASMAAGELAFVDDVDGLSDAGAFAAYLAPLRKTEWIVYAKPPFGGPEAVLAYLSRYTHRNAPSSSRLISTDSNMVAFKWRDYRAKDGDPLPGSGLLAKPKARFSSISIGSMVYDGDTRR